VIDLLRRLFDPAYLYAIDPGPLGRWGGVYAAWIALLLGGLWAARRWRARSGGAAPAVAAGACALGVLLLGLRLLAPQLFPLLDRTGLAPSARYLLLEAWTARVWPLSLTAIALLVGAMGLLSQRCPAAARRLTGAILGDGPALPGWASVSLTLAHLAGLSALWRSADRPLWWSLPTLALLLALPLLSRPRRLRPETLLPLLPAYAGAAAHLLLTRLQVDVGEYQAYPLPDPFSPWFNLPALVIGGVSCALWLQVRPWLRDRSGAVARVLTWTLVGVTAAWLVGTTAVHHTRGVTASDPYCYTQMAIDLVQNGSALHAFPLAGLARELDLPTWPAVHIGYHPPGLDDRAPTMWSIGWPALMAPLYALGGLPAIYLAAPIMAALALAATWGLVNETLRRWDRTARWTVAALTCLLVATSPEGSERMLAPMADAAAQLFTTLTLWLILRAQRGRWAPFALLAGASFGMAYWIRHPQLPLGISAAAAALLWPGETRAPLRRRIGFLALFGLSALAVALPDLAYHRRVFGGWLHSESTEWFLLSISNVGRSFWDLLRYGALRRQELGFVAPFGLYGAWRLWREHRRPALIAASGTAAVLFFHLFYGALRPRDLIALLPVFYGCAAVGLYLCVRRLASRPTLGKVLAIGCCVLLVTVRSEQVLSMPWRVDVITFGHVRAEQLQGFQTLAERTPEDAVIGSMLNGGAIELHAGRQAVHPAPWTAPELYRWTDALLERGRPFFLLDDGEDMPPVLERLEQRYRLRHLAEINVPYFSLGGGNAPQPAQLYVLEGTLPAGAAP